MGPVARSTARPPTRKVLHDRIWLGSSPQALATFSARSCRTVRASPSKGLQRFITAAPRRRREVAGSPGAAGSSWPGGGLLAKRSICPAELAAGLVGPRRQMQAEWWSRDGAAHPHGVARLAGLMICGPVRPSRHGHDAPPRFLAARRRSRSRGDGGAAGQLMPRASARQHMVLAVPKRSRSRRWARRHPPGGGSPPR